MDGFAEGEVEGEGWAGSVGGDVDALGDEGFEVHLDAGLDGVPEDLVAEGISVEVGAKVAVEAGEDVEVEGGGGAGGVVVGGEEGSFGFVRVRLSAGAEVGAEEEGIAGEELGAEVAEDVARVFGGEVADAGADVEGQGAGVGKPVEGEGLAGVVGYLDADGDTGEVGEDVFAGSGEGGLGDVNGLIDDASLLADGFGEEESGLGGGTGAQLDEGEHGGGGSVGGRGSVAGGVGSVGGVGPVAGSVGCSVDCGGGFPEDLRGVEGEDAALGAGGVVLGELGDLLEECGAGFVVEEPWREGFRAGDEAGAGLLCYMRGNCVAGPRKGGFGCDGECRHLGSSRLPEVGATA